MRRILRILRRVFRAIQETINWLSLPFDIHTIWNFFWRWIAPALPALVSIVLGFLYNAPYWQIALLAGGFFVFFYFGAFLVALALRRHATSEPQTPTTPSATTRDNAPTPPPTVPLEIEAQERWRGQDALERYLNQMQEWLDDEARPLVDLPPEDSRRKMARTNTLAVLERIGAGHKKTVMRFLQEHDLIRKRNTVIFLGGADLSGADLRGINLIDTSLVSVNFSGADLTAAKFSVEVGTPDDLAKAQQRGIPAEVFMRPTGSSRLDLANFSGAVLNKAYLMGCILLDANFDDADLDRTDLRGADLLYARNLTQEQIEKAYGGVDQEEPAQNTRLPDYLQAPASWSKPIHEQKRAKGNGP